MLGIHGLSGLALSITLATSGGSSVAVGGAVKKPGIYTVAKTMSVTQALRENGGLLANADDRQIRITSVDGETRIVNLRAQRGIETVAPGDIIEVPFADTGKSVFVRGALRHQGVFDLKPGMTVGDVIKEAELAKINAVEKAQVQRAGPDGTINVTDKNLLAMKLMLGDTVVVPYGHSVQTSDRELLTIAVVALVLIVLLD